MGDFNQDFSSAGIQTFNVWSNNPLCSFTVDGKTRTGCNGADIGESCGVLRFMSKEAGVYVCADIHHDHVNIMMSFLRLINCLRE